jgi:hypothetical protein
LRIHCVHLIDPIQEEGKGFQCAIGNVSCPGVCNVGRLYSSCNDFKEPDSSSHSKPIKGRVVDANKKGTLACGCKATESNEAIHIKQLFKKVINAKVACRRKGTIKHFDNTIVV